MTAETLTLTEFLLARIAEDEHIVRLVQRSSLGTMPTSGRGMRDLEFKRWLIARHARGAGYGAALAQMSTIYADHPDYREEWKP